MTPADLAYRQIRMAYAANRAGLGPLAGDHLATARAYLALSTIRPGLAPGAVSAASVRDSSSR